jgi:AraC-like DNA-binding protein
METQIGFELCTAGTVEKVTVNGKCNVTAGTLMILSPVFPTLETNRSTDYQSVTLTDSIEEILPLFSQLLPDTRNISAITPFIQLTGEQQRHFMHSIERIRDKKQQLHDLTHPFQIKIQTAIIKLLRQETLLEHAFLFSNQLLQDQPPLSHKRRVMMTFLLTLNMEYQQHRAVNYYAEKQGLTPRHFADIIKQESDYTPMEWINMVTINQAKNLLRQPDIHVKRVADELGFPEQFTFRKYFKTHTGMSPTEFRKGGR